MKHSGFSHPEKSQNFICRRFQTGFKHARVCFLCVCVLVRWVEEDPREIMQSVHECIERTCEKLCKLNIDVSNIKGRTLTVEDGVENEGIRANSLKFILFLFSAVGVTNQRETTLVWDKDTGEPLYNAIGESVSISIFGFLHRCQTHQAVKKWIV